MQKSYECEVATHIGPESCGAARKGGVEALTGESRTSATHARTHPRPGPMAASGGTGAHSVLRRAPEPKRAVDLSVPSGTALASRAVAAQPKRPRPLGSHAAHGRPHLRQEPDAVVPLVRSRGGGCEQS